jgi:hypothetical protein
MRYLLTTIILCAVLLSFVGCTKDEPVTIKVRFSPSDTFAYTGEYGNTDTTYAVSDSMLKEFSIDCVNKNDTVMAWAKMTNLVGTLKLILLEDNVQVAIDSVVDDTVKITVKYTKP